jgi:hypothetical protein
VEAPVGLPDRAVGAEHLVVGGSVRSLRVEAAVEQPGGVAFVPGLISPSAELLS